MQVAKASRIAVEDCVVVGCGCVAGFKALGLL
jgi:hypothetical protein